MAAMTSITILVLVVGCNAIPKPVDTKQRVLQDTEGESSMRRQMPDAAVDGSDYDRGGGTTVNILSNNGNNNKINSNSNNDGCFAGNGTVTTRTGALKPIRDVRVGDAIWDGSDFSEVFMLAHADPDAATRYVTIDSLELTPTHLVVIGEMDPSGSIVSEKYVAAETVAPGDMIRAAAGIWRPVKSVSAPQYSASGTFAPLTMSGSLVVNGIACSAYTKENVEHGTLLTTPLRLLYQGSPGATSALITSIWDAKTAHITITPSTGATALVALFGCLSLGRRRSQCFGLME